MTSNNIENSFMSNFSKLSHPSYISSPNTNNFTRNNKLYQITVEMAVNYNLMIPSKNKDFISLEKKSIFNQNGINNEDRIDFNKLSEIMKILSKYDN